MTASGCSSVGSSVDFELTAPPVLSRSAVMREEPVRSDLARQVAGWPTARLVVLDEGGRTPVEWGDLRRPRDRWDMIDSSGARLITRPTSGDAPPDDAVLLGEHDGVAYWGMRGQVDLVAGEDPTDWADLRTVGAALDALGAGLLTGAVALLNWHSAARFCTRDGSLMHPRNAGWHRVCEANSHEEYPRTDPAVICLVHDGDSGDAARVLLARQPVWPEGRFSVLAGFVEAGESLEVCVAREIHEEVGVTVRDVRYLGSQAWPFPRSLMIGFHALADPDVPLHPAEGEIAEAMWVTRAELRKALEDGDWSGGAGAQRLLLPGRVSIARSMLESWAVAD